MNMLFWSIRGKEKFRWSHRKYRRNFLIEDMKSRMYSSRSLQSIGIAFYQGYSFGEDEELLSHCRQNVQIFMPKWMERTVLKFMENARKMRSRIRRQKTLCQTDRTDHLCTYCSNWWRIRIHLTFMSCIGLCSSACKENRTFTRWYWNCKKRRDCFMISGKSVFRKVSWKTGRLNAEEYEIMKHMSQIDWDDPFHA